MARDLGVEDADILWLLVTISMDVDCLPRLIDSRLIATDTMNNLTNMDAATQASVPLSTSISFVIMFARDDNSRHRMDRLLPDLAPS